MGKSQQLSVNVLPNDATNKSVTWSVSDESVATISTDGLLSPKTNGVVTITATANDASGKVGQLTINISGVIGTIVFQLLRKS